VFWECGNAEMVAGLEYHYNDIIIGSSQAAPVLVLLAAIQPIIDKPKGM